MGTAKNGRGRGNRSVKISETIQERHNYYRLNAIRSNPKQELHASLFSKKLKIKIYLKQKIFNQKPILNLGKKIIFTRIFLVIIRKWINFQNTVKRRFCHVKWRSKLKWQYRTMTKPNIGSFISTIRDKNPEIRILMTISNYDKIKGDETEVRL